MIQSILHEIKRNWNKLVYLQDRDGITRDYLFQPGWLSGKEIDENRWTVYNTEFTTDQVERIIIESDSITIELK